MRKHPIMLHFKRLVAVAAYVADVYGCLPGHYMVVADAQQAHRQADMKGAPAWLRLPTEARPYRWKTKFPTCVVLCVG